MHDRGQRYIFVAIDHSCMVNHQVVEINMGSQNFEFVFIYLLITQTCTCTIKDCS